MPSRLWIYGPFYVDPKKKLLEGSLGLGSNFFFKNLSARRVNNRHMLPVHMFNNMLKSNQNTTCSVKMVKYRDLSHFSHQIIKVQFFVPKIQLKDAW